MRTDPHQLPTADQLNTLDTPRRFFLMDARMKGLPVDVLHAFDEKGASTRVRLLSVRSMVDAHGAEFTHAYARVGPALVSTKAETRWHADTGAWTYGEFELTSLAYNVAPRQPSIGRPAPSAVGGSRTFG